MLGEAVLLRWLCGKCVPCNRRITGIYEYGCDLFKKRIECAIMMKVSEASE